MGYIYVLISALFQGTEAIFSKRLVQKITPLQMGWGVSVIESFLMLIVTLFLGKWIPGGTYLFFKLVIIISLIMAFTRRSMALAFQKSDIGIVMPMTSFLPVFSTIFGIFILGEYPSWRGIVGIIFIVVGSFRLQFDKKYTRKRILLAPFTDLGARIMIFNSLLWGVATIYSKIAIMEMNVYMYMIWLGLFISLFMTIPIIWKKEWKMKWEEWKSQSLVAFLKAGGRLTLLTSFTLIYVAYALSIKRLSGVFAVILGYIFLKEQKLKERLGGSLCMLAGVVLLIFGR